MLASRLGLFAYVIQERILLVRRDSLRSQQAVALLRLRHAVHVAYELEAAQVLCGEHPRLALVVRGQNTERRHRATIVIFSVEVLVGLPTVFGE